LQKYRILDVCSPHFAPKAICSENKIRVFFYPVMGVVLEDQNGSIEVSEIDPMVSMMSV